MFSLASRNIHNFRSTFLWEMMNFLANQEMCWKDLDRGFEMHPQLVKLIIEMDSMYLMVQQDVYLPNSHILELEEVVTLAYQQLKKYKAMDPKLLHESLEKLSVFALIVVSKALFILMSFFRDMPAITKKMREEINGDFSLSRLSSLRDYMDHHKAGFLGFETPLT